MQRKTLTTGIKRKQMKENLAGARKNSKNGKCGQRSAEVAAEASRAHVEGSEHQNGWRPSIKGPSSEVTAAGRGDQAKRSSIIQGKASKMAMRSEIALEPSKAASTDASRILMQRSQHQTGQRAATGMEPLSKEHHHASEHQSDGMPAGGAYDPPAFL